MVSRIRLRMALFLVLANVVGVAIVVVCILWVVPGPPIEDVGRTVALNGILVGFFFVVIVPIMSLLGEKWLASGRQWLIEGRVPTDGPAHRLGGAMPVMVGLGEPVQEDEPVQLSAALACKRRSTLTNVSTSWAPGSDHCSLITYVGTAVIP